MGNMKYVPTARIAPPHIIHNHTKHALLHAFTCAAVLVILSGCSDDATKASLPETELQPFPVRVVKPSKDATSGETQVISSVRSKNEATISAKTSGQILKLDVKVGDRVKSGQLLVRIDSSMAAIQLQNAKATQKLAQANRANASAELERAKALQEQGALSDANFDRIQMAFDIASAQTEQALAAIRASGQQISDANVIAPFSGVVSARFRNLGDTVSGTPPTALLSLVDPDQLEVRMAVPEALAPMLRVGNMLPAKVSPSGLAFQVRVSALGATVDTVSRTVEVLADVVALPTSTGQQAENGSQSQTTAADPYGASLKPGALAIVDVAISEGLTGLYLQASAVRKVEGKNVVDIVVGDHLQRKEVTISTIRPGTVLVTSGVGAQDDVALDAEGVPEGHAVRALSD